jgi:hypothetical protein
LAFVVKSQEEQKTWSHDTSTWTSLCRSIVQVPLATCPQSYNSFTDLSFSLIYVSEMPPLCQVFYSLMFWFSASTFFSHMHLHKNKILVCVSLMGFFFKNKRKICTFELVGRLSEWFWFFPSRTWSCAFEREDFTKIGLIGVISWYWRLLWKKQQADVGQKNQSLLHQILPLQPSLFPFRTSKRKYLCSFKDS